MVVKLAEDKYIEWDDQNGFPLTRIMSRDQMNDYLTFYLEQRHEINEFLPEERAMLQSIIKLKVKDLWKRLDQNGSTCLEGRSCEKIIENNKASQKEAHLTRVQIIKVYTYDPKKDSKFPFKK